MRDIFLLITLSHPSVEGINFRAKPFVQFEIFLFKNIHTLSFARRAGFRMERRIASRHSLCRIIKLAIIDSQCR